MDGIGVDVVKDSEDFVIGWGVLIGWLLIGGPARTVCVNINLLAVWLLIPSDSDDLLE